MAKNKNIREDIGTYLRDARISKSLTGFQLGKLIQISQQQISRYERGETNISFDTLDKMLTVLDKNWSDFFYSVIIDNPEESSE